MNELATTPLTTRVREGVITVVRAIRPEEWLLLALWVVFWALCVGTGTGFSFERVGSRYLQYFAIYILVLVAVSRLTLPLIDGWRPQTSLGERVKRWVFGDERGLEPLLRVDAELVRGFALLVISLTMYTNLKARFPALRPETFDATFAALDSGLFANIPDSLRALAANDRLARSSLADIYTHDWFYAMGIVYLGYFRRDAALMRWVFGTLAIIYMLSLVVALGIPTQAPFYLDQGSYAFAHSTSSGRAQEYLIEFRANTSVALDLGTRFRVKAFAGIVSFPNVDVAQLVAAGLIGLRVFRPWAAVCFAVGFGVYLATLALGWGYAVDGIAAVGVALIAVQGTQYFVRWRRPPPRDLPSAVPTMAAPTSGSEHADEAQPDPA